MVTLSRTVRFSINDPGSPGEALDATRRAVNSFAGHPAMHGWGRHYELEVECTGKADPTTGYFLNIKQIDAAVRERAIPLIAGACAAATSSHPALVLPGVIGALKGELPGLSGVRLRLSPYYCVEMSVPIGPSRAQEGGAEAARGVAALRQRFEFAAAHRLHCAGLTEEENRRVFGKCNNPQGHGHNYELEVCVEFPLAGGMPGEAEAGWGGCEAKGGEGGRERERGAKGGGAGMPTVAEIERIVDEVILARFDHKHLNEDVAEFSVGGGLTSSVENIARVCFGLLEGRIAGPGGTTRGGDGSEGVPRLGVRLRSVTVWETPKTSCTYPA